MFLFAVSITILFFVEKTLFVRSVIVSLEGKLIQADILSAVIDVGGIGFFINIPLAVSCKLPKIGEQVKFCIYPVYREDRRDLYGFFSQEERDFFKLVVEKVSGIGPRTALNIMSKLSLAMIKEAISSQNPELLSKCHGVGKKSAERIIMELGDKDIVSISSKSISSKLSSSMAANNISDAMSALISLGYKTVDAEKAVRKTIDKLGESASTEDIIRSALGT